MVKEYKKNPTTRRNPRLSRTKLLCAAGLTLCNFTITDAAQKAEGYLSESKHHNPHGSSSEIFLPAIDDNEIIDDTDLEQTSKSVNLGSHLIKTPNPRPITPPNLPSETAGYPRVRDDLSRASEKFTQNENALLNRPINGLPRPPPPQWIRDDRYEQPQTRNVPPMYRFDRRDALPNVHTYPNTKKNKREANSNAQRDDQSTPPNFVPNARVQPRRVPLHLQPTQSQPQQNIYQTQQQQTIPSSH